MATDTSSVAPQAEAAHGNLTNRTLHGLKWAYSGTAAAGLLQIGVTATMSRLLPPAVYGIIAGAGLFIKFGSYFSEMGVGQALVQKPSVSEEDVRAAFTATTGIGLLVGLAICLASPFAHHVLDAPEIGSVVRLLALGLVLDSCAATSLNILRRHLRFQTLSIINTSAYAISAVLIGIPLAVAGAGVWAVTAALICRPAVTLGLAYNAERHSLRLSFNREAHKALLSYGARMSVTCFAEYLFLMADAFIVGRYWGSAALGIYSRANLLSALLITNISTSLMEVLFPVFSRVQADRARLTGAYTQGLVVLNLVAMPIAIGMIPAAADIVGALLGAQYAQGVVLVRILALAVPCSMAAAYAATVCNVSGEIGPRMRQQIALTGSAWIAVWIAEPWGPPAIAAAAVSMQAIRLIAYQRLALRELSIGWRRILLAALPGARLAAAAALAIWAVSRALAGAALPLRLGAEIGIGAAVFTIFCLCLPPAELLPLIAKLLNSIRSTHKLPILEWYRGRVLTATAE